jgi:hypothetical protein
MTKNKFFLTILGLILLISITQAAVTANFTANSTYSASYPMAVNFTDSSVCDPNCTNWAWDFNNDGAVESIGRSPTHVYTAAGNYTVKMIAGNGINSGTKLRYHYIFVGPAFVQPTIPQPTAAWTSNPYGGTSYSFSANTSVDTPNSTFLKYWLQNFTATGNFSVYGFANGIMAPLMHVFGFWIYLIIWACYLFAVWIRTQNITLPLVIGIISGGIFGFLFPKEALPVVIIMFVICGAIIFTRLFKDSI